MTTSGGTILTGRSPSHLVISKKPFGFLLTKPAKYSVLEGMLITLSQRGSLSMGIAMNKEEKTRWSGKV
jgi:hypothetical protein